MTTTNCKDCRPTRACFITEALDRPDWQDPTVQLYEMLIDGMAYPYQINPSRRTQRPRHKPQASYKRHAGVSAARQRGHVRDGGRWSAWLDHGTVNRLWSYVATKLATDKYDDVDDVMPRFANSVIKGATLLSGPDGSR
ncbi:hypothetical protein J6590_072775 [Homalodisca vitripennis]|nr:hypothetical protein J6590_072775 [Homalodisca vitripennis]